MKKLLSKITCGLWARSRDPYNESKWVNKLHYKMCSDYNLGPNYKYGGKVIK